MRDIQDIKDQIREAFATVESPGDWCLRDSNEGDEPFLLEQEFRGKCDWRVLDADFLDQAPGGYGSALSFFSDEAFRFYLPAYLIADLDGRFTRVDPVFHLCLGLDDQSCGQHVNSRRYGERTWSDVARHKFAMFTRSQAAAIAAYLQWRCETEDVPGVSEPVEQALRNYWLPRAGEMRNL